MNYSFLMGYYSSLIERKFRGRTIGQYEQIRKEYADFLMSEEEMRVREIKKILIPIDYFVEPPAPGLVWVLSVYQAEIHIAYIVDRDVLRLLEEIGGAKLRDEYQVKKEVAGREKLAAFSRIIGHEGIRVTTSLFTGSQIEDALRLSEGYDIIAVSRGYGSGTTEAVPASPAAIQVTQRARCSVLIY
ncbi:MAG: universal stress protein [Methanomicrobiales archaeon]|nr:universal stress protein [Methanomicrobiales archaeon]